MGVIGRRRARRHSAVVALALAAGLVAASSATAASTISVSSETITLADGVGEPNDVTVNHGNNPGAAATVRDFAGIVPIAPCAEFAGIGYTCPTPVRPTFVLDLGAGDDFAQVINSEAEGTHSELRGGDGNDRLWSYEGSDTLDGGAGDDELKPDDTDPSRGDDVRGGRGTDHLQLASALSPEVVATLDDRPDDGQPGHGDNYRSDIENVSGSQFARNTIVGTAGPNVLVGRGQADRLTGAGGRDTLNGDEGSDTIDALDGAGGDRVTCGGGADLAHADAGDVAADDCERVGWAPAVASSRLQRRAKRISVRLRCPKASAATCRGKLRLTTRGGKTLAAGSYRIGRGKAGTVRLKARGKPTGTATLYLAPKGTNPVAGRRVTVRA